MLLFLKPALSGDADLSTKAERLVRLRLEVDDLEKKLTDLRAGQSAEKYALETQKADLSILIGQEKARRHTLVQLENEQKRLQADMDAQLTAFVGPAEAAANLLKTHIDASIPFRKKERLAAVDDIVLDLKAGNLDAITAVSRLWQVVEDELTMVSEVRTGKQIILLDKESCLADVVRLGMSVMYFKVDQENVGLAVKTGERTYEFRRIEGKEAKAAVNALFDAMKKQIHQGEFDLLLPKRQAVQ